MGEKIIDLPTIIRDSREHADHGYKFIKSASCSGMQIEALPFGDYAIKGYPDLIIIERKQDVNELIGNLGANRSRFERELQKMIEAKVKYKYIVVEDYWSSVFKQSRYSKMKPQAIFGSIISLWLKYEIPFIFAGGHETAHNIVRSLLLKAHKYRIEGKI
jgi:ERCC4-type nuclease